MLIQPLRDKVRKSSGLIKMVQEKTMEYYLSLNWNFEFIKLMQNRMIFGLFRYGAMKDKNGMYDNIEALEKKLKYYKDSGNLEALVDAANICMLEFVNGVHPKKHFKSLDDSEHAQLRK